MKGCTIVGARPQFIKAATVSRVFSEYGIDEVLVHTGQHYDADMSDVFFEQMELPKPHHHLGVGGGRHDSMTGRQLEKIEEILLSEKPDWVLVYGDTNSTLAGALAAAKLHIPVAQVEAGLRSFNRRMPEEVNRVLTDHVSTLLFAPTCAAEENLAKEGISGDQVKLVADVMYDATLFYKSRAKVPEWLDAIGMMDRAFALCTSIALRILTTIGAFGVSFAVWLIPACPSCCRCIRARGAPSIEQGYIFRPTFMCFPRRLSGNVLA